MTCSISWNVQEKIYFRQFEASFMTSSATLKFTIKTSEKRTEEIMTAFRKIYTKLH